MKLHLLNLIVTMALLISCSAKQSTQYTQAHIEGGLEHYVYKDSTERAHINIDVTVPIATDSSSALIRDSLISVIEREFCYDWENTRTLDTYKGEDKSLKAIIDYYGSYKLTEMNNGAESDFRARTEYLAEDTTITPEERQQRIDDTPQWEYESKIIKEYETPKYVVYLHNTYQYLGGAHGGVGGNGNLTFDTTGKKIEKFFVNGAEKRMQKLLISGLIDYFSENTERKITQKELMDYLLVDNGYIPLPVREPYLSSDGMVLTYQQYEIAAYAAGMPSFIIAYKDVLPFLTEEVKTLISPEMETNK